MDLAVNAADAMLNGGNLTFETTIAELDASYAFTHQGVDPGTYAMVAKSVFEPFFSTKGEYATGLGMATVYGIVKQHGGNVRLYR